MGQGLKAKHFLYMGLNSGQVFLLHILLMQSQGDLPERKENKQKEKKEAKKNLRSRSFFQIQT
jgi:hypothetical protein